MDDGDDSGSQPRHVWAPLSVSQAASDQDRSADDRDNAAADQDTISETQDRAAEVRDERADARDRRADARAHHAEQPETGAAGDRAGAWRDRRSSANDRQRAADDRKAAASDRFLSARERRVSSIDELTGAHRRDPGLLELARETARAKRTHTPLVLAFSDVDGLKATNDSLGHAAGDHLLSRVVQTMRTHLRAYDLIIRFGGDEFLCVLPGLTITQASKRFQQVNDSLAARPSAAITTGLAELAERDSVGDLIGRADAALRAERRLRQSGRT